MESVFVHKLCIKIVLSVCCYLSFVTHVHPLTYPIEESTGKCLPQFVVTLNVGVLVASVSL